MTSKSTGPKRDPLQREKDLEELARRYIRKSYKDLANRETQASIAADFGVSQAQISYDIRTLKRRWQTAAIQNIEDAVSERIQELYAVMEEAWVGWETSLQPKEREIKQKAETAGSVNDAGGADAKGKRTRMQVSSTKVDSSGNPAYLNIVLSCISQIRELRGLDKPTKTALTTPDGDNPYNPIIRLAHELSDDELARIAATGSGD